MSLQDEIDTIYTKNYTDSLSISIGEMVSLYKEDELDIHPEFQRVFKWNLVQKSKLIESILLGIPLPSFFVSQRDDGVWDIVDGVQRLSTIFEFMGIFKDENGTILPPSKMVETKYLPSLKNKMWESDDSLNSLTNAQRIRLKRFVLNIQVVRNESDPNIKYELFQRLNSFGTNLSDQELRNCLLIMLNRDFYYWLKDLANYGPFLNCVCLTEQALEERYNLELALRFMIFKNVDMKEIEEAGEFSNLDDFITKKMMECAQSTDFNREYEASIFKKTFDLINKTLGENAFKKYSTEKEKFDGIFLLSSFDTVGIGIGANIEKWSLKPVNQELIENLTERARSLWAEAAYLGSIGSEVSFNIRISTIVPLGKKIFIP